MVTRPALLIRAPLQRVPENQLKFAVGVMLTSFGTFWSAEGAGASWPGGDAALLVIIPGVALFALAMVARISHAAGISRSSGEPSLEGNK